MINVVDALNTKMPSVIVRSTKYSSIESHVFVFPENFDPNSKDGLHNFKERLLAAKADAEKQELQLDSAVDILGEVKRNK